MSFTIEIDHEEDGRWIADVVDMPGVVAYGSTREEAISKAEAVALRVLADRVEHSNSAEPVSLAFAVA